MLRYGAHLSKAEVAALVAPHQNTVDQVHAWLDHHGIPKSSISPALNGDWLSLTAVPVQKANAMLGTKYGLYRPLVRTRLSCVARSTLFLRLFMVTSRSSLRPPISGRPALCAPHHSFSRTPPPSTTETLPFKLRSPRFRLLETLPRLRVSPHPAVLP